LPDKIHAGSLNADAAPPGTRFSGSARNTPVRVYATREKAVKPTARGQKSQAKVEPNPADSSIATATAALCLSRGAGAVPNEPYEQVISMKSWRDD